VRALALAAAALLALAAPAAAARPSPARPSAHRAKHAAKALRFATKRARKGARVAPGWRATASLAPVVEEVAPSEVEAAPGPVDAPVEPAGDSAPEPVPAAPACDPSPWLGAIAEDAGGFRLRLTRTCVPAGVVRVQFRNTDLADHNLWAEGVAPAAAQRQVVPDTPGETTVTASAPLAAGTWRLYCSLPGHETMSRLVEVTPAS
jgi:hypothetical protein